MRPPDTDAPGLRGAYHVALLSGWTGKDLQAARRNQDEHFFQSLLTKRLMRSISLLVLLFCSAAVSAQPVPSIPSPPSIAAKSYVLFDYTSGQSLAAENENERLEPASLTKLMTAYITFAALRDKRITLDQTVPVSVKAWRAGGSRMFIEPRKPVTVEQLMNGMIVQSGNDACIALAEAIAGAEEVFAQMMNQEAQRLGMKDTHFTNATGLPDPDHYSTAHDLALLAIALVRDFPEYYALYSKKEYTYNNIKQANRNRLLWTDPTVDGMKTGHTEKAGYCLIASAKRGDERLISVVLGTDSERARASESQKLLNYGFQFFDTVRLYEKNQAVAKLKVWKGDADVVEAGFTRDLYVTLPRGQAEKLKASVASMQPLIAPVKAGDQVATLKLMLGDKVYRELPVVALKSVPLAGFFGRGWDSLRLIFQ